MNQVLEQISTSKIKNRPVLDDYLYYVCHDPFELFDIFEPRNKQDRTFFRPGVIESADSLQQDSSLTLYPMIPDGVSLYTPEDVRAGFRSGIALVFDKADLEDRYYLPHFHQYNNNTPVLAGGVMGSIDLSLIKPSYIFSLGHRFELTHPMLTIDDLAKYTQSRKSIVKNRFSVDLPEITTISSSADVKEYNDMCHFQFLQFIADLNLPLTFGSVAYTLEYKS